MMGFGPTTDKQSNSAPHTSSLPSCYVASWIGISRFIVLIGWRTSSFVNHRGISRFIVLIGWRTSSFVNHRGILLFQRTSDSKTMVGPVQCIIELLAPPTRFCACWSQKSNHLNFLSARPLWIEIFRTRIIFLNTVTSVLGNPVSACNFAIVAGGRVLAHFVLLRIERWMTVCPHAITPLCMPDCKSKGSPTQ